ncbi:MAG: hypothetical protein TREMPRED_002031 [Tremellales sp. Tagirdzhanova-0007]|nr:MAG: hypothetical protein TREMPRED_002031 [Tremellales sp. Tagirdzhanova-0007]
MSSAKPVTVSMVPLQRSVLGTLLRGAASLLTPMPSQETALDTNVEADADADFHNTSIRFCHMDLHPGNIMVHQGRLSGIIDGEICGWYTSELETFSALKQVKNL